MSSYPSGLDGTWWSSSGNVSEKAFKISIWICISLCIALAALRFSIRLASFRRLFIEDYVMIFSLLALITVCALLQHFLGDIYTALTLPSEDIILGPDFPDRLSSAIRATGVVTILNTVGIWGIKLNFMSFFQGFGRQIKRYMVFWWTSFILVIACGVAQLGVLPYSCTFGSLYRMLTECANKSNSNHTYKVYEAMVAFDIVSDAIIICFPVFIIWRTKINLRQKILLTGVFLLVGFTITVTILRGCTFSGLIQGREGLSNGEIDIVWMLFCYLVQYTVSFIIACIISFRSLWVNKERRMKDRNKRNEQKTGPLRAHRDPPSVHGQKNGSWRQLHDTLMQTLRELEGVDMEWDGSYLINHEPSSGRLTVEFSQWDSTSASGSSAYATSSTQHSRGEMVSSV